MPKKMKRRTYDFVKFYPIEFTEYSLQAQQKIKNK